jgi:UDP-N-acetylglucosamine 2-epimerase
MKLITIVGARPQFIKAAPVAWAIQRHNEASPAARRIESFLCHTGQHYDHEMSRRFFEELELSEPDVDLGVGSGSHGEQTGRMLEAIEKVLLVERPDQLVVYGDTNSTLAGALAAAKLSVPIAHVEAGLRSFDRSMPEEVNRVLTDHLSSLLFVPTTTAVGNLDREGLRSGVHLVGDVMYDLALRLAPKARGIGTTPLSLEPKHFYLVTVHRPVNADDPDALRAIFAALGQLDADVIFPVHPRTKRALEVSDLHVPSNVRTCPPAGYLTTADLVASAKLVLTDSGGLQKEAFFHRVPCVTLRDRTEWVETVEAGWNVLAGNRTQAILDAVKSLLDAPLPELASEGPYGEGRAAEAIVQRLLGDP